MTRRSRKAQPPGASDQERGPGVDGVSVETVSRRYVKVEPEFFMALTSLTPADVKVLTYLVLCSGFSGESARTQSEVAKELGLTIRTVSRTYLKLRKLGIIAIAGHRRVIFNPQFVMRGKEDTFGLKLHRYRQALNGKPVPDEQLSQELQSIVDQSVRYADNAAEDERAAEMF